jgi:hypothetical protein
MVFKFRAVLRGQPAEQNLKSHISGINQKYGVEQIFKEYWFEGAPNY